MKKTTTKIKPAVTTRTAIEIGIAFYVQKQF